MLYMGTANFQILPGRRRVRVLYRYVLYTGVYFTQYFMVACLFLFYLPEVNTLCLYVPAEYVSKSLSPDPRS